LVIEIKAIHLSCRTMFSKISAAVVAALAVTAQATPGKHPHFKRYNGPAHEVKNNSVISVAPSSSVPLTSPPVVISVVSLSPFPKLVGVAVESAKNPIPQGTGSGGPPNATPVTPEGIDRTPGGTAPLNTQAAQTSSSVQPGAPEESGQVENKIPEVSGKADSGVAVKSEQVTLVTTEQVTLVTTEQALLTTVGTGSATTVLTTTIKRTTTKTVLRTVVATETPSSVSQKGEVGATGSPDEPTTTIFATVTSTRKIVIEAIPTGQPTNGGESPEDSEAATDGQASAPGEAAQGGQASEPGKAAQGGQASEPGEAAKGEANRVVASGDACPAQVTVTVTQAPVTVTVTAKPSPGPAAPEVKVPIAPALDESSPIKEVARASALPSFPSARFNNGTDAAASTTAPSFPSSGFLTRTSASFTLQPTGSKVYRR
jgi:hypothetical protein